MARVPLLEIKPIQEGVLWLKHYIQMHRKIHEQTANIVNGKLSFGDGTNPDNIQGNWVTVVSTGGSQTLTHGLGKPPVGILTMSKTAPCDVSLTSSTNSSVTIQTSAAGVTLRLFIL